MKIFVIHGSMRKGNTYKLTQEVISRLLLRGAEISEMRVSDLKLPFCVSCHTCFVQGEAKCPHYPIMKTVTEHIESCDALVISGAVYSMHLNAATKNLIDHVSYYYHRPRLFATKGLVITTTAGAGEKTVAKYLKATIAQWGVSNIQTLSCKIQTDPFSLSEKQTRAVDAIAKKFHNIIMHNKTQAPSMKAVIIHNAFRGQSAAEIPISEYDKAYWHETGLISKVYPRRINIWKRAAGSAIFTIMKKMMSKSPETKA
jgi:multimeric flavodoxin WrbA